MAFIGISDGSLVMLMSSIAEPFIELQSIPPSNIHSYIFHTVAIAQFA
jgi:hypothetical protein